MKPSIKKPGPWIISNHHGIRSTARSKSSHSDSPKHWQRTSWTTDKSKPIKPTLGIVSSWHCDLELSPARCMICNYYVLGLGINIGFPWTWRWDPEKGGDKGGLDSSGGWGCLGALMTFNAGESMKHEDVLSSRSIWCIYGVRYACPGDKSELRLTASLAYADTVFLTYSVSYSAALNSLSLYISSQQSWDIQC